ncbi:MAG: hypothetical protein ABIQ64_01205 [Candidatus Saccharimonadales bacterium]
MRFRNILTAPAVAAAVLVGTAVAAPVAPAAAAGNGYISKTCLIDGKGARLSVSKWRLTSQSWQVHVDLNSSSDWAAGYWLFKGKQYNDVSDAYFVYNSSEPLTITGVAVRYFSKRQCSVTFPRTS